MTPNEERWAEALAIERITQLGADGDVVGVARFMKIIDCLDMLRDRGPAH